MVPILSNKHDMCTKVTVNGLYNFLNLGSKKASIVLKIPEEKPVLFAVLQKFRLNIHHCQNTNWQEQFLLRHK